MASDDAVTARFVLDLAQHLTAHCKVSVLAPAGPRTQSRERWGEVDVWRFQYAWPARLQALTTGEGMVARMRSSAFAKAQAPAFVAAQWAALPRVARAVGADLLNPHWIVPQGFIASGWARSLQLPMVVTAHGADVALLGRMPGGGRLGRYVFARSAGFIADSAYLARRTEEIIGQAIPHAAIPMGVETSVFAAAGDERAPHDPRGPRTLLFVGKFVPKKGISVLLDAVARLRAAGRDLRLQLIGGGPLEDALRADVARLGIGDAVAFLGWVKNHELPSRYVSADVVCVPSIEDAHGETEGTPVVLQEALACGSLIVASRSSGIGDVLRDGENGWTVPPGDAGAMAAAVARALDAPADVQRMVRAAARATAGENAWPRVAARFYERFTLAMASGAR